MEDLYKTIISNNIYIIITSVFICFIGYSIFKKLFKIAIIIFVCLAIYIGYIYVTGDKESLKDKADKGVESLKEKAGQKIRKEVEGI
tara:strand:- start:97 stop:357 length:261 start_codon:yes stop_codon:yes gene_type:complete